MTSNEEWEVQMEAEQIFSVQEWTKLKSCGASLEDIEKIINSLTVH